LAVHKTPEGRFREALRAFSHCFDSVIRSIQ